MKNVFKIDSIEFTIEGQPISIKGIELETEASAQELSVSGGNINQLVNIIGDIADRFDKNSSPKEIEVKEIKTKEESKISEPVIRPVEIDNFKEVESEKNIIKELNKIQRPSSLEKTGKYTYRWENDDVTSSVTIDSENAKVIAVHIHTRKSYAHIYIRETLTKYTTALTTDNAITNFNELCQLLDISDIPEDIQEYVKKVVSI